MLQTTLGDIFHYPALNIIRKTYVCLRFSVQNFLHIFCTTWFLFLIKIKILHPKLALVCISIRMLLKYVSISFLLDWVIFWCFLFMVIRWPANTTIIRDIFAHNSNYIHLCSTLQATSSEYLILLLCGENDDNMGINCSLEYITPHHLAQ